MLATSNAPWQRGGMDRHILLEDVCACFGCAQATAEKLLAAALPCASRTGQHLGHQGDVIGCCWVLLDGAAAYQSTGYDGRLVRLSVLGKGDLIGAPDAPITLDADIITTLPSSLLRFDDGALMRLADADAHIGAALARLLARQLQLTMHRLVARTTLTAPGRIYAEICTLMDVTGGIAPPPTVSDLAITAQTTRETASRAIAVLERRGILVRGHRRWDVTSRRLLEELIC